MDSVCPHYFATAFLNYYYYCGLLFIRGYGFLACYDNTGDLFFTNGYGSFTLSLTIVTALINYYYYYYYYYYRGLLFTRGYDYTGDLFYTNGYGSFTLSPTIVAALINYYYYRGLLGYDGFTTSFIYYHDNTGDLLFTNGYGFITLTVIYSYFNTGDPRFFATRSKPLAGPSPWSGYGRQLTLVEYLERERRPCSVLNGHGP